MSNCHSCRHRAFLLCISSHDVSECLVAHPAGKGLFSCVYLLMMFQNVLSHILQAKGFYPVCIFARHFWSIWLKKGLVTHPTGKRFFSCVYSSHNIYRMFLDTSFRQMSFLPCVSYRDVSECLFAHHILQAKGFSPVCIFTWHFKMSRHTSYTQIAFLPCVSSHDILKCLVTHLGDKWIFFCVYLLMTFQNFLPQKWRHLWRASQGYDYILNIVIPGW